MKKLSTKVKMMNRYCFILFFLLLFSCNEEGMNYSETILENDEINTTFLHHIQAPEKALLSWYLYAYGNECGIGSSKKKCQLLKEMNIQDECDVDHLNNLLQWFSSDMLVVYKLNQCPNLPIKSAIQNTFERIVLIRKMDTLSIQYSIKGINNSQEKSWNINQIDSYVLKSNTLIKINKDE